MMRRQPTNLPPDAVWVTPVGIRGVLLKDKWITSYSQAYDYLKATTGMKDMTEEGFHNLIRELYREPSAVIISKEIFNRTRMFISAPELGRLIRKGDTNWDKIQLNS